MIRIKPNGSHAHSLRSDTRFRAIAAVVATAGIASIIVGSLAVSSMITPNTGENAMLNNTTVVKQLMLQSVCPGIMQLADREQYGDAQFTPNSGDIHATTDIAALGSFFSSTLSSVKGEQIAQITRNEHTDYSDYQHIALHEVHDLANASVLNTMLLESHNGTGAIGATVSSAHHGDLKGLSAAPCMPMSVNPQFLVTSTEVGNTQQLVLINSSEKSTTVRLEAFGVQSNQPLTLNTNAQIALQPKSVKTVDLHSAIPNYQAFYLKVMSQSAPIAAVVRHVRAAGLTAQGSDYNIPLTMSHVQTLSGFTDKQSLSLQLFSATDMNAQAQWIGEHGPIGDAFGLQLHAHQVLVNNDHTVPEGAIALRIEGNHPLAIHAMATQRDNHGEGDFSSIGGQQPLAVQSMIVSKNTTHDVHIANVSSHDQQVKLFAYDNEGALLDTLKLTITANSAQTVENIPQGTHVLTLAGEENAFTMSSTLFIDEHRDAAAGVAVLPATSVMVKNATVTVSPSQFITS